MKYSFPMTQGHAPSLKSKKNTLSPPVNLLLCDETIFCLWKEEQLKGGLWADAPDSAKQVTAGAFCNPVPEAHVYFYLWPLER